RLLLQRLLRRRRGPAARRPDLAGYAALAQSQLGAPDPDSADRKVLARRGGGWLERPSRGRHFAAEGRADEHGSCLAPDRPRCRRVVPADAVYALFAGGA